MGSGASSSDSLLVGMSCLISLGKVWNMSAGDCKLGFRGVCGGLESQLIGGFLSLDQRGQACSCPPCKLEGRSMRGSKTWDMQVLDPLLIAVALEVARAPVSEVL